MLFSFPFWKLKLLKVIWLQYLSLVCYCLFAGSVTHKVEHSEIPNTTGTHSSEIGSLSTEMKTDDDTEEAKKRKGTESGKDFFCSKHI